MGIDLSGKFSPKTRKVMKSLGAALGLDKSIEFKNEIDSTVIDDDNGKKVDIDIKTVSLSTKASQLKDNIKAMVENCKTTSLGNIDLKPFFEDKGILESLSKSSFTSSKSNFKNIYKFVTDNDLAELIFKDVNKLTAEEVEKALATLTGLRKTIITYLTLTQRNTYTDTKNKFDDGRQIDKCKVFACHTLLLGLKQLETKLKDRRDELGTGAKTSPTAPGALPGGKSQRLPHRREEEPDALPGGTSQRLVHGREAEPGALPGGTSQRLVHGREAEPSTFPGGKPQRLVHGREAEPSTFPDGKFQRLAHGREAEPGEQPEWNALFRKGSSPIATKLWSTEGPTKYFVHLSNNDKPDKYDLRIVGSADNGKTVLISNACKCVKEIKQINDHEANPEIIKKWKDTKVFVYDNTGGLLKDGIIDRLKKFYPTEMGDFSAAPTKPAKPAATAKSTSNPRSALPSNDVDTKALAGEIYDFEHTQGRTPDGRITTLKKDRLALQLSDGDFETRQKEMTDISKKLLDLKKNSDYYKKIQKNTWQCKFASEVLTQHKDIFKTFGFGTKFDDLALGVIGTENMDHYHEQTYLKGGARSTSGGNHHGAALSSGRTSGRYARLYRDQDGKLHALQKTPEEVMNARSGMILNLLLKTLTKNGTTKSALYDLPNTIRKNAGLINTVAEEIQNMNAYHQCSDDVFEKMLKTKSVVSMDQLLDPLVGKNDKEKLQIMWKSLSAPPGVKKPDEAFRKLMNNYKTAGVANFLKACVGEGLKKVVSDSRTQKAISGIPIETLRLSVSCFKTTGNTSVDSVSAELRKEARLVESYVKNADDSTLVSFDVGGLGSQYDARAGTNTTVFSILGGNKVAIEEYALKGQPNGKGCIIEIPKECVSYVSPYAILLDANISVKESINRGKGKYAVVRPKDDADKYNDGIKLEITTGCPGEINTTGGLIAFADHPYIDKESWAGDRNDKYTTVAASESQISQLLRSRKLDPRNKKCATVLAIYMYCQYVILNNGACPASAQTVLEASYQKVGSHACIEGHSPGNLPLGSGGIERVLMIGYTDGEQAVNDAKVAGLKVKCISAAPATRKAFIAEFNGCT